jgi:hypothetical protein
VICREASSCVPELCKLAVLLRQTPGSSHRCLGPLRSRELGQVKRASSEGESTTGCGLPTTRWVPRVLVPGPSLGTRAARPIRDKAKLSTFHTQLAGRWGRTPTLHWPSFPPLSVNLRSPFFPSRPPFVSHFENPSRFPPCTPPSFWQQPPLRARATSLRSLQQDDTTGRSGERPFYSTPPVDIYFHDHITNEQLHDSESGRHTLNPTGARERARKEKGDLNYRSVRRVQHTAFECRCHCRRCRRSTSQPTGSPAPSCKRDNRLQDAWRKRSSHAIFGSINTGHSQDLTRPREKVQVPVLQPGLQQKRAQEQT